MLVDLRMNLQRFKKIKFSTIASNFRCDQKMYIEMTLWNEYKYEI